MEQKFPLNSRVRVESKTGCHYKRIGKVVGYSKNMRYVKVYFASTGITTFYSPDSLVKL
jgi:hypothetical protein